MPTRIFLSVRFSIKRSAVHSTFVRSIPSFRISYIIVPRLDDHERYAAENCKLPRALRTKLLVTKNVEPHEKHTSIHFAPQIVMSVGHHCQYPTNNLNRFDVPRVQRCWFRRQHGPNRESTVRISASTWSDNLPSRRNTLRR